MNGAGTESPATHEKGKTGKGVNTTCHNQNLGQLLSAIETQYILTVDPFPEEQEKGKGPAWAQIVIEDILVLLIF